MPIVQGSALWNLQRVFNHPRSSKETDTKDARSVPSAHTSSFWKSANASSLFQRFSSTPCHSPKRSASAPQGLPQKYTPNPGTSSFPEEAPGTSESSSISKSTSAPHAFTSKPNFLEIPEKHKVSESPSTSDDTLSTPQELVSSAQSPFLSPCSSDASTPNMVESNYQDAQESSSGLPDNVSSKPLKSKLSSSKLNYKGMPDKIRSAQHPLVEGKCLPSGSPSPSLRKKTTVSQSIINKHASCSSSHSSPVEVKRSPSASPSPSLRKKTTASQSATNRHASCSSSHSSPVEVKHSPSGSPSPSLRKKTTASQSTTNRHASCSSSHSSPVHSPLKSPHHSSRRASTQGEQLPVAPSPPWSELMEARRRLMAVECRRRALCALETRVQQVHYVFLQAELRVARQKEGLAKLVEAAGRAEVQTAVHGQRIRKALRRHKPRLLACALCVPWPSKTERRSVQHPRHSRCAFFQGRIQGLRGCVGNDELATRD